MQMLYPYSKMKVFIKIIPFLLIILGQPTAHVCAQRVKVSVPQLGIDPLKTVIKAMTLEEKAHLVVGNDQGFPRGYPTIFGGPDTLFGKVPNIVGNTKQLVAGSAGTTYPIARLGITAIVLADGPAGIRIDPHREGEPGNFYATAFPVATLLASTWDINIVNRVGKAMGNEVLEYGVDVLLAPALNIHRNPLGGRNFEYYSEDPVLTGKMAVAMVSGIQANGVGTSVKHFAANNNEVNRMSIDAVVSPRALREIYLKGFKMVVQEAKPWTLMSAYNKINGNYSSERSDLLTEILRKEWGFKGLVMTDWFAGRDQVAQIAAGNDLIMPGSSYIATQIAAAVRSGKLREELLDRDVENILTVILKTPRFRHYVFSSHPDLKQHAIIAKEAAEDGMVLLQNTDQVLPLKPPTQNVALFGNAAYQTITGGTGSGDVNKSYSISIYEGLLNTGFAVDTAIAGKYKAFYNHALDTLKKPASFMDRKPVISELDFDPAFLNAKAKSSAFAIFTLSRISGEFHDRNQQNDFYLTARETRLIKEISIAFHRQHKPFIVILNTGGVIDVESWKRNADAILLAWQPGQEAGNAVSALLTGKISPSGKLATTFPLRYSDVSSAENFPAEESNPSQIKYEEGVYVGYRYFQKFKVKPLYAFGFGLSYTKFIYSNPKINSTTFNGKIILTLDVKNTGTRPGKEVVQCYLSAPAKSMDKPMQELKGFAKTQLLQPGQTQKISFELKSEDLASFSERESAWIADAGTYQIRIGASSDDIRLNSRFYLSRKLIVEKVQHSLFLKTDLKEVH